MRRIYLDNAATTKPDPKVLFAMDEVQEKFWGNASSIYNEGQGAKQMLEDCRKTFAFFIDANPEEVIFTSGGTESDNLAIRGVIDAFYGKSQDTRNKIQTNLKSQNPNSKILKAESCKLEALPHVITSSFEHHAVLDTVHELEKQGHITTSYINPDHEGIIKVSEIEKAINKNTILISIMYVNNEVGTVQPIRKIAQMLAKKFNNKERQYGKIYFHTDAVQATEYFELGVKYLGVDLLSLAAHKFHGPKGVGLLYVRAGTPLQRQQIGGGQERKKRAGTENVAGIRGMVTAYEMIFRQRADEGVEVPEKMHLSELKLDKTTRRIINLRDKLIDGILKNIPDTVLNGSRECRSPANTNISFKNAEGESIIMMLDMAGIAVSSGSACTSGSLSPSHVLLSMGIPAEEAHGSIRFTLSKHTTEEEIDKVLEVLPPIIEKLRKMSPFKIGSVQPQITTTDKHR